MKGKLVFSLLIALLLGISNVFAQDGTKKLVIDLEGVHFCVKHAEDILDDVKGVEDYELSPCGRYLTVYYDVEEVADPAKLEEQIKLAAEAHHQECMKEKEEHHSKCRKHHDYE